MTPNQRHPFETIFDMLKTNNPNVGRHQFPEEKAKSVSENKTDAYWEFLHWVSDVWLAEGSNEMYVSELRSRFIPRHIHHGLLMIEKTKLLKAQSALREECKSVLRLNKELAEMKKQLEEKP